VSARSAYGWGTGSIWYGSPQDRSEAVRSFVIEPALGVRWGYRRLTPALKAKMLGLAGAAVYRVDRAAAIRRAATDRSAAAIMPIAEIQALLPMVRAREESTLHCSANATAGRVGG
jgi:hypothetical protein